MAYPFRDPDSSFENCKGNKKTKEASISACLQHILNQVITHG